MHNLKIGIVINQNMVPSLGGAFSYYKTLLHALNDYAFDDSIELVNVIFYNKVKPEIELKKPNVFIKGLIGSSIKQKVSKRFGGFKTLKKIIFPSNIYSNIKEKGLLRVVQALESEGIDILYYLTPIIHEIDFPYIITHWDLAHKSTFAFPEISMTRNYESRETYYSKALNKALMILCESETSIKELTSLFAIDRKKIEVFPIFGNQSLRLSFDEAQNNNNLTKFKLQNDAFFLYPAQFWSLKNHYNLILAFDKFLQKTQNYQNFKLVLCGSDKGNLVYIEEVIKDLNLQHSVIITGFIEDEELYSLYSCASALVFPAFLGPTNMPLIEAAEIGCPVICSDLEGHRELLGNHAIYFNPTDADQLSKAMAILVNDSEYRKKLITEAKLHINNSKFNLRTSLFLLNKILIKLKAIRKTWGINSMINSNV